MKTRITLIYILLTVFNLSSKSQDYRSHRVKDITHITFKNNGIIQTDTCIIQINTRMGDHDAKAAFLYQKGDKASFGDVWLEDMNGNIIRKLKKNEIKESSFMNNFSLYEDRFIKYFETKHHQYPYRLIYTWKREQNKVIDIISLDYANTQTPILNGKIIIQHHIDDSIKYQFKNMEFYTTDTINQVIYHTWNYAYSPEKSKQIYSAVNHTSAPKIDISPINFKYGVDGTNKNWETLGNWEYRLNANRDKLPLSEQNTINKLIAGVEDKQEIIKILYHYLQDNTRYINISTKEGGHQTYPAEYVSINKYGDCKALTNFMYAMLKHVNITSYYTPIYADEKIHDLNQTKRIHPVDINALIERKYISLIHIPEGYSIAYLPPMSTINNEIMTVTYTTFADPENKTIKIEASYALTKESYPAKDYDLLKESYAKMITKLSEMVILKKEDNIVTEKEETQQQK